MTGAEAVHSGRDGAARLRVCVVDPNVRLAVALAGALRRSGYAPARGAPDGDRYDAVLLDPAGAGRAGPQCAALRERGDVGIIVMMADATERDRIDALRAGADDVVAKPFCVAELFGLDPF